MERKYNCIECNYKTDKLYNYKMHMNSKRHMEHIHGIIENKEYICRYCKCVLKHTSSLYRHERKCKSQFIESQNEDLKKEIDRLTYEKNITTASINELKNNFMTLTKILAEKPTITKNTLNYVSQNYINARPLEPMKNPNDYAKISLTNFTFQEDKSYETKYNTIELELDSVVNEYSDDDILHDKFENTQCDILSDNDNEIFVKDIIGNYNLNTLEKRLGDFLLGIYLKKNKAEQSLHLTDHARLRFIFAKIRKKFNNDDSSHIQWMPDPCGINIIRLVIDPMLKFINIQIDYFQKKLFSRFRRESMKITEREHHYMEATHKIKNMLSKDNEREKEYNLRVKILEYIAPYFQFNKQLMLESNA
jgi:prefoldin subunit 5